MHDFFVNHRTEGTTVPPDFTDTHPLFCPLRLKGNQCGLEKNNLGTVKKQASLIVRWLFAVGGFWKLRRMLESAEKCSEAKRATENRDG